MKKIALIMSMILAMGVFTACGAKKASTDNVEGTLSEIMAKLYEGVTAELPAVMDTEINAENSEMFLGVAADTYKEALASDAMISAVAHSVCLVRAESAEAAEALAKDIEAKADPRKWICVEAEKKLVATKGDLVLLVMSFTDAADELKVSFDNLK